MKTNDESTFISQIKSIDLRDIIGLSGIILIGVGFWWIFPPLGLILPGIILAGVAIIGDK
jgi:hypothetical protein